MDIGQRIVILGGGFGGYYTAKGLEKSAPKDARITLISDTNFLTYTPLLPGAAAGTLDPRHIVMPLRESLKRTELRLGWVTGGDPSKHRVNVTMVSGLPASFEYDQLVVALGSVSRTFPVPGLVDHAIGFKTVAEATALRNRIVRNMELAEGLDDPFERRSYLNFVFVGGGYAGLEGIAELEGFARDSIKLYPRCAQVGCRFVLVDVAPRVMPEIQPKLAAYTMKLLGKRGIEFKLSTSVNEVLEDSVVLSEGERIPCRTVVWTAGVKASPSAEHLGLPLDGGRIVVDSMMRVQGFDNVWAIGDVAAVPDPARPGMPCPPTAQHAIRQGMKLSQSLPSVLKGGQPKEFKFKTLGAFADIGRHKAVANMMGLPISGFVAWAICRFYHLAWMPGLGRKSRLIADWTVEFFFPRDVAEMGQLGHAPALETPALAPVPELPSAETTELAPREIDDSNESQAVA